MELDGAKNAQAEILTQLLDFEEVPQPEGAFAADAGMYFPTFRPKPSLLRHNKPPDDPKLADLDARRLIGIGVAPPRATRRRQGYEVAILVQRASDLRGDLVDEAKRMAAGEATVIYTGPIRRPPVRLLRGAVATAARGPLRIGDSIGHYRVTAGTLGCFVDIAGGGGTCVLSNNHVLADCNSGATFDPILSPAQRDGGRRPKDQIAALYKYVPIDFAASSKNLVDAAVAKLADNIEIDRHMVYGLPGGVADRRMSGHVTPVLEQDQVMKVGRTTGGTRGFVSAIGVSVGVFMTTQGYRQQAFFSNQIQIESDVGDLSDGGDSGSVVFNEEMDAVGLIFAGARDGARGGGKLSYANPMGLVLGSLNATL